MLVVGVDGTDTSWRALYYAFGLARRQGGAVVAAYSFSPILSYEAAAVGTWSAGLQLAQELCDAIEELAAEQHVPAEFVSSHKDPALTLIELADERRADAIVVGASRALAHRLFGSTAVRTVRRSRCPVTVVP